MQDILNRDLYYINLYNFSFEVLEMNNVKVQLRRRERDILNV